MGPADAARVAAAVVNQLADTGMSRVFLVTD